MHLVLRPLQPPAMAGWHRETLGTNVQATALGDKPQGGAHERTQTLIGSVCPDDAAWLHGACLG